WWVQGAVEGAMQQQRLLQLTTVLDVEVTALRVWMGEQRINAALIGGDEHIPPLVEELLALADGKPGAERRLTQARALAGLRARRGGPLRLCGYTGFFLVPSGGVVLAAEQDMPVGKALTGYRKEFFDRVLAGQSAISKPFRSPLLLADENGELRAQLP